MRPNDEKTTIPTVDLARMTGREISFLAAAVVLALLLRLVFFRGALSIDDFNYLRHAAELWKGRFELSQVLYLHGTRGLVFVPISWLFGLLGPSEAAAVVWPLIASIATMGFVYSIGRMLLGREGAVYAAILSVFLPMFVDEATRILPGAIMNLVIAVCVYTFLLSERAVNGRRWWLLASGIVYGAMPLTGELGLLSGCFYPLAVLFFGRHRFWSYWPVAAGFVVMIAVGVFYQWLETGDPMFKVAISRNILQTEVHSIRPFYYLELLVRPFAAHGGVLYLAGAGALFAARRHDRRALFLVAWFVATWLLIEYISSSLTEYRPLYKYARYASILAIPGVLLSGFGLTAIRGWIGDWGKHRGRRYWGGAAVALLLVVFFATSMHTLTSTGAWARERRAQLDHVSEYVRSAEGSTIYVTHWLWNTRIGFFMGFEDDYFPSGYHPYHAVWLETADANSKNRYVQTLAPGENMAPGLLIHDETLFEASRGIRKDYSLERGEIPEVLAEVPQDWRLLDRLMVGRNALAVFEIPPGARWPSAD
jgi:4-amino-4-deoxy-L-arabinose transferase-like glycosyltransferase